jgi:hypothetical protein
MKYGLYITSSGDWLREADKSISLWNTIEDADKWRRNYTVFPKKYEAKRVTPKIIREDSESINK